MRMDHNLKRLLRNEAYLCCVILAGFAAAAAINRVYWLAIALAAAALVLLLFNLFISRQRARSLAAYVQTSVDALSKSVAASSPYPFATVRLSDGEILWHNRQLEKAIGTVESCVGEKITDLFPDFSLEWLRTGQIEAPSDQTIRERRFRCLGYVPRMENGKQPVGVLEWVDSTELLETRDEYLRSRPVVSVILIDNYDELMNNLSDTNVFTLNAALNERISAWAGKIGGLLRKLERNRFLFIFESKELYRITEGKFSLLESVREVTNPAGIAATVSFGVGKDGSGYQENYDFAILALEMALSRGGDQAVIKDKFDFSFYGGRAAETERRSKVKSRTMASSLSTLIEQSGRVFLMGHRNADADVLGAAAGVAAICRSRGKKYSLVVDVAKSTAPKLIDLLRADPQYRDVFLSGEDALLLADANSLLVVVDTNRPDQVESKPLLESATRIAVIDHHRRAADYIATAAVNHHEPSASSASELVTELLTYTVDAKDLLPCELAALMAGIVLDTKNFTVRVNSRTFEAAAFLRDQGADPVEIKRLFQTNFEETVTRYHIIEKCQVYRSTIAVACWDENVNRALAGQAADEILGISGIDTSFVLFRQGEAIFISARAIGRLNVQMILEPLGGGGNAATAGAQLRGVTMMEARDSLVEAIDRYFEQ